MRVRIEEQPDHAHHERPFVVASTNTAVEKYFEYLLAAHQLTDAMGIPFDAVVCINPELTNKGDRREPQLTSVGEIASRKVDRVVEGAWGQHNNRIHKLPKHAVVYGQDVLSRNPNTNLPLFKNSPKTLESLRHRFGKKPFVFPWEIGVAQVMVSDGKPRAGVVGKLQLAATFEHQLTDTEIGEYFRPALPQGVDLIGVAHQRAVNIRQAENTGASVKHLPLPPEFQLSQEVPKKRRGEPERLPFGALPFELAAMTVWKLMDWEMIQALAPTALAKTDGHISPEAVQRAIDSSKKFFPQFAPHFLPPSATMIQ